MVKTKIQCRNIAFFALEAFDLFTISLRLNPNHSAVGIFEESVKAEIQKQPVKLWG